MFPDKSCRNLTESCRNAHVFDMGKWGDLSVEVGFWGWISENLTSTMTKPNIEDEVFGFTFDSDVPK